MATLISTRPQPAAPEKQTGPLSIGDEKTQKLLAEAFLAMPSIAVRGRLHGIAWDGRAPSLLGPADGDPKLPKTPRESASENPCILRVPKGLVDVTMDFGMFVQRFQLGEKSPKLFGCGTHIDRIDHDLTGIKLYRYRDTTLKVHVIVSMDSDRSLPGNVEAHYVREKEMRDAGAILVSGTLPFLSQQGKDGDLHYSVLPDEEIEVSATARGMKTTIARVRLKEGEVRELTMTPTGAESPAKQGGR